MRWTLCYTLMTACLGSVLAYGFHDVKTTKPSTLLNRQLEKAFASNEADHAPVVRKSKKVSMLDTVQSNENPTVEIGATRDEVLAVLGTPAVVNETDDRWTYGLHVIMFNNDVVSGCVRLDEERAANVIEQKVKKAGAASKNFAKGKKTKRNPYARSNSSNKYASSKYGSRPARLQKGSARGNRNAGYRTNSGSSSGYSSSYYMSRSGPRFQSFFSKLSRPRGMSGLGGNGTGGRYSGSWGNSWNNAWGGASGNRGYSSNGRSAR